MLNPKAKVIFDNEAVYEKCSKPRGDGKFFVVKTSYERYKKSRMTHNGSGDNKLMSVPDVWRINPESVILSNGKQKPDFVAMTEDIQFWIFRLNVEKFFGVGFKNEAEFRSWAGKLSKDNFFVKSYRSLFKGDRSHTNRAGSDTHWDFISKEKNNGDLMKFSNLVTGRFIGKLVSTTPKNIRGALCYPFECINISKMNYKDTDPKEKWWLFDEPLLSGRSKILDSRGNWTGKYNENLPLPYPQFNPPSRPILPVMLPYDDVAWIDASIIRILDDYEPTPSKYSLT